MITLTIDESTLNATRAALDERVKRLEREVAAYQANEFVTPALEEDRQRALVWNIAALHETKLAQEFYAEVEPGTDHPADASYHEASDRDFHSWQAVGPR